MNIAIELYLLHQSGHKIIFLGFFLSLLIPKSLVTHYIWKTSTFMIQLCFIVPFYDESFSFEELLPQLLHDHLFAALLLDAGLAAILVAAVFGSGTSCGNNLHFKL